MDEFDPSAPFGMREDGTPKSTGFLGRLKNKRGDIVTEFSAEEDGMFFPLIVPTLSKKELEVVMKATEDDTVEIPDSVYKKAMDHAKKREKEGKSSFWNKEQDGEEIPTMPSGSDPFSFYRSQSFKKSTSGTSKVQGR